MNPGTPKGVMEEVNEVTDNMRDRIGGWLLDKDNTRQKLADLLGISVVTLANHMNGTTDWSWTEVCKLADILGCNVSNFR